MWQSTTFWPILRLSGKHLGQEVRKVPGFNFGCLSFFVCILQRIIRCDKMDRSSVFLGATPNLSAMWELYKEFYFLYFQFRRDICKSFMGCGQRT